MTENQVKLIKNQCDKIFYEAVSLSIIKPCTVGDGILQLTSEEFLLYKDKFDKGNHRVCVFIPASGSGSRMFEFVRDYLYNPSERTRGLIEKLFSQISDFAFYQLLSQEIKEQIVAGEIDWRFLLSFLMEKEGLNYGELPKGLFPFHCYDAGVKSAIAEHIQQSTLINASDIAFHFTIQKRFEDVICNEINNIENETLQKFNVTYSEQDESSNSFVFNVNKEPIKDEHGNFVMRPAGHGALLSNLSAIDSSLIFIKNIDNIQHFSKSSVSILTWSALAGILVEIRASLKALVENPRFETLVKLNEKYGLYTDSELSMNKEPSQFLSLINRPIRVCGMVKNEGYPGGGPFMVEKNGIVTKQIIEKAQVIDNADENILFSSTHFNPVMMVVCKKDLNDMDIQLSEFVDDNAFLKISKSVQNEEISFLELPGLWNGSMYFWNSVFVEIPNETFSPVKSALDLLSPLHMK
jgi:hypothetical protein